MRWTIAEGSSRNRQRWMVGVCVDGVQRRVLLPASGNHDVASVLRVQARCYEERVEVLRIAGAKGYHLCDFS